MLYGAVVSLPVSLCARGLPKNQQHCAFCAEGLHIGFQPEGNHCDAGRSDDSGGLPDDCDLDDGDMVRKEIPLHTEFDSGDSAAVLARFNAAADNGCSVVAADVGYPYCVSVSPDKKNEIENSPVCITSGSFISKTTEQP